MVTLQLVSIYDLTCAMVISAWVGVSGLWMLKTIGRLASAMVTRASNDHKVHELRMKYDGLSYELDNFRKVRKKRRNN